MFRRLMNFDEFRAAYAGITSAGAFAEAVRQQREYFRDPQAAEAVLGDESLRLVGWIPWDGQAAAVRA
ncbi:MAG TPA: hypothetical protein VEK57_05790 [Thermoanaerobaculia bacterium]|nr:hypothetical protein [Thermoanaerobaculia bacterium]